VFIDGACDCVKLIFIWQYERNAALCLLPVHGTAIK